MELRFGTSTYVNHQTKLFNLNQVTTVTEYQACFEKLCNCIVGLTPQTILNCFILGLQPELCRKLGILNLFSISQAIGLAKLIEEKCRDSKIRQCPPPPYITNPLALQPR